MRKGLLIAVAVMLCSFYAVAQDYPKAEVFGGFSYTHLDTEGLTNADVVADSGVAGSTVKTWYPGWEAAVQYNLTKLLGVEADLGGNYGKPVSVPGVAGIPSAHSYNFLFGPVVSYRTGRLTPFAHALFGANRFSIDGSALSGSAGSFIFTSGGYSETAFAMAFGGGVDFKLAHHFSVRLGQLDYLYTKHCISISAAQATEVGLTQGCQLGVDGAPPAHQNNLRLSTGIVIH